MKDAPSPRSAALLVVLAVLIVVGNLRMTKTGVAETTVTVEPNEPSPPAQPLFPGQPTP